MRRDGPLDRHQLRRRVEAELLGEGAAQELEGPQRLGLATGPVERDTRGIAESARVDERWIGALLLAPAVLDAWRYFHPESKWAAWSSRGVKIGMAVLIVR